MHFACGDPCENVHFIVVTVGFRLQEQTIVTSFAQYLAKIPPRKAEQTFIIIKKNSTENFGLLEIDPIACGFN